VETNNKVQSSSSNMISWILVRFSDNKPVVQGEWTFAGDRKSRLA